MPRKVHGKSKYIRTHTLQSEIIESDPVMSAKEIRARMAAGFPVLPIEIQDAYVRLMEANLTKLQSVQRRVGRSKA